MRLCANSGARLHLVGPIAFDMSEPALRRAGLDYRDQAVVTLHESWPAMRSALPRWERWFAVEVDGARCHTDPQYERDDVLVFGREQSGLPPEVLADFPADHVLRIPMVRGSRSLNLANAAAVVVYEAWRQLAFVGSGR